MKKTFKIINDPFNMNGASTLGGTTLTLRFKFTINVYMLIFLFTQRNL